MNSRHLARLTSTVLLAVPFFVSLVSCGRSDTNGAAQKSVSFSSVNVPSTDLEKRQVVVSRSATVNGKSYPIAFNTILRSGDRAGDVVFGAIKDRMGKVINRAEGPPFISKNIDFSSLLIGKTDKKLYMVSHFEESPAAMYITELSQDSKTGKLSPIRTRHIDYSNVNGGWAHCAGSVTPWGTHLGSEEYEPDAQRVDPGTGNFNDEFGNSQARYFGLDPKNATPGVFNVMNAYDYGWLIEVSVDNFDTVTPIKHYSMGRFSHELGYVMPDKKTAYMSDDSSGGGLFRFVADNPEDLRSGELFVARWNQVSADKGGRANITWISLGKATDAEVKGYITSRPTFAQLFDSIAPGDAGACPAGYASISTSTGHECLRVKVGMERAASRLETRRYAAIKGGTTEFTHMEGITFDPNSKTLYVAMSYVHKSMLDNAPQDKGGPNHIRVPRNQCGIVYGLDLDANFAATKMYGVLQGIPRTIAYGASADNPYPANGSYDPAMNKCDLEGIANPDNITFMPGYRSLLIDEDTGDGHQNDAVWAYNIETKKLTRIQTTPYGSEATSIYFYPNINAWGYLMSVVQHPYGESDQDKTVPGSGEDRAYVGYIGPFPSMR